MELFFERKSSRASVVPEQYLTSPIVKFSSCDLSNFSQYKLREFDSLVMVVLWFLSLVMVIV